MALLDDPRLPVQLGHGPARILPDERVEVAEQTPLPCWKRACSSRAVDIGLDATRTPANRPRFSGHMNQLESDLVERQGRQIVQPLLNLHASLPVFASP